MTIEEYLKNQLYPDREFVDGHVIERNLGLRTHSEIDGYLRDPDIRLPLAEMCADD